MSGIYSYIILNTVFEVRIGLCWWDKMWCRAEDQVCSTESRSSCRGRRSSGTKKRSSGTGKRSSGTRSIDQAVSGGASLSVQLRQLVDQRSTFSQ